MHALLAATPIVAILALMLALGWSAVRAGLVGLVLALGLAFAAFGFPVSITPVQAVLGVSAEALFIAFSVLWIIFPALCIHHYQLRTGAVDHIRAMLAHISDDPRIVALVIGWFFALFMEGVAGFGTPIALAAPLLVGVGFSPVIAVIVVLVGHAAGVSFGAVGTPIMPQASSTGLGEGEIAAATAAYHAPLGWIMLAAMMLIVSRARRADVEGRGSIWGWALLAGALFLLPYWLIARWIGPELPTVGGALIGGMAFIAIYRVWSRRRASGQEAIFRIRDILIASAPYLVVLALILATRLIPPVQESLSGMTLGWQAWDIFQGRIQPFYHPGTLLLLGFLIAALARGSRAPVILESMRHALLMLSGVVLALVLMLGLARVMLHAGLIDTLAEAAASGAGGAWPFLAPFIGVLGSFVTGSATASNILFTDFQYATATALGMAALPLIAAQGFGAAVGNMVCPHNVIAGCATVGLKNREGEILARTVVVALVYAAAGGALALVYTSGMLAG
ncbi:MAG: L-lactate permease [Pseudomonadota bacterium]